MAEKSFLLSESLLRKVRKTVNISESLNKKGKEYIGAPNVQRYIAKIVGKYEPDSGARWSPTLSGSTYEGIQQLRDSTGKFSDGYQTFGDDDDSGSFPPIIDLQSLSEYRYNESNSDLHRIPINSIVEVFPYIDTDGIIWWFTAGPANESFWAKITGESAGFYSWTMLDDDGITESSITGSLNAKEVQGRTGISTGEIVRMWPDASTDNTLFCFLCHSADDSEPVDDETYTGEHSESAATGIEWDRSNQGTNRGVKRTLMTGVAYYDTSDATLYGYVADFEYDANGHLVSISEERRVTIEVPQTCD